MHASADSRRLSIAVLAHDTPDALRETLNSVHTIADELFVVDPNRCAASAEVASQFNVRTLNPTWDDDFATVRNAVWEVATGDWLLWLDSGERLDHPGSFCDFVHRRAFMRSAYAMLVRIPALGPSGSEEQMAQIRLFPRRAGISFAGRVRETALDSLAKADVHIDGVPHVIWRGLREHDPQLKSERARRNLRLVERELTEGSNRAALFNCLGESLQTLGQHTRAGDCYRRSLVLSSRGSAEMLEAYYGLITSLDDGTNHRPTQIAIGNKALEAFPLDAQLLCAVGQYLQAEGQLETAAKAYRSAVQHGQIHPLVWHVPEVQDVAAICLSLCLQKLGQDRESLETLHEAALRSPESMRVRRHLIDFHLQRCEVEPACEELANLSVPPAERETLKQVVRGAVLAVRKEWLAAATILEAAYSDGCRDPLCVRWLSIVRLHRGDPDAARNLLREWKRTDPTNVEIARLLRVAADATPGRSAA